MQLKNINHILGFKIKTTNKQTKTRSNLVSDLRKTVGISAGKCGNPLVLKAAQVTGTHNWQVLLKSLNQPFLPFGHVKEADHEINACFRRVNNLFPSPSRNLFKTL